LGTDREPAYASGIRSATSLRGGGPTGPRFAVIFVDGFTSSGPPARDHATISSIVFLSSAREFASGIPSFDAGQGGM
jgi:hypothetical protein